MTADGRKPSEPPVTKHIFLPYVPRACHHLFMRMFSGHDELDMLESLEYMVGMVPPTIAMSGKARLDEHLSDAEILRKITLDGFKRWQTHIEQSENKGRRVLSTLTFAFVVSPVEHNRWLNEKLERTSHIGDGRPAANSPSLLQYWQLDPSRTSPESTSIFPDSFLQSHIPVLLIRHPALAYPSTLRVAFPYLKPDEDGKDTFMNLILRYRWMVLIFEWYTKAHSTGPETCPTPLILDADDLMYNPEAMAELCQQLGLDAAKTKYTWPRTKGLVAYESEDLFQETLSNSESVVPGKSSDGLDIEFETQKWMTEFGERRARLLRKLVDEATEDYLFLRERRVGAALPVDQ